MKTKRIKKNKTKKNKMKGGISEFHFYTVHPIIQALSMKEIHFEIVADTVQTAEEEIIEYNKTHPTKSMKPFNMTIPDWGELITASFKEGIFFLFDNSEIGMELQRQFDYSNPASFSVYSGKVSDEPLHSLYRFVLDTAKKTVYLDDIVEAIEAKNEEIRQSSARTILLTESDWLELIAESFEEGIYFQFDGSELGTELAKHIDYDDPSSFSSYLGNIVVNPTRRTTITQSYQGKEPTCFAHSAALLLFHNVYKLSLGEEDKKLYLKNNCNLHLDTTRKLEDYHLLKSRCGESGAAHILLFLYIYRVIVKEFGCSYGHTSASVIYYLNTPFQPTIFGDKLNAIILPIYNSVRHASFVASLMDMSFFTSSEEHLSYLNEYFKKYYASLTTTEPRHVVTLTGLNQFGVLGKNSGSGTLFTISYDNFKKDGSFKTANRTLYGINDILFLYEKRDVVLSYPKPFSVMLYETTCEYKDGGVTIYTP